MIGFTNAPWWLLSTTQSLLVIRAMRVVIDLTKGASKVWVSAVAVLQCKGLQKLSKTEAAHISRLRKPLPELSSFVFRSRSAVRQKP